MQCVVLVTKLIIALARTFRSTCKCVVLLIKVVFILCRRAFAWARKPYRIVLPFIHKNGDFRAISITEGSCADLKSGESHIGEVFILYQTAIRVGTKTYLVGREYILTSTSTRLNLKFLCVF